MKTKRYIVQFKSVYQPAEWLDAQSYDNPDDALDRAKFVRLANPNVRIVEREITQMVLAEL